MKTYCAMFIMLCLGGCVEKGQTHCRTLPRFEIPTQFGSDQHIVPVEYLSDYPIMDKNELLTSATKTKLKALFIAAYEATRTKYNQDMLLETTTPIYCLLKVNYPEVKTVERESGHVVFLGDIVRILNDAKLSVKP